MEYFTRAWASGRLSDEACEQVQVAYEQHLSALLPKMPKSIAALANEVNLHDGLIGEVIVNSKARRVTMELRCGDVQTGYSDLTLSYSGVRFEKLNLATLARRARDRRTELLCDEVDVDESGDYVHRILFWPKDELSIAFSGLQIAQNAKPDRCIVHCGDPYKTKWCR